MPETTPSADSSAPAPASGSGTERAGGVSAGRVGDEGAERGGAGERAGGVSPERPSVTVRRARTSDVPWIQKLTEPLVQERVLLGKDSVVLYEAVQEFRIAVDEHGTPIGCGALHVFWEDLGEVRTLAVDRNHLGKGIGHALLERIEQDARDLGLSRLFCLTFEVSFFERHDFTASPLSLVDPEVYMELVRSPDEGVAEFLDLARVKPNTLGNTRMLKHL